MEFQQTPTVPTHFGPWEYRYCVDPLPKSSVPSPEDLVGYGFETRHYSNGQSRTTKFVPFYFVDGAIRPADPVYVRESTADFGDFLQKRQAEAVEAGSAMIIGATGSDSDHLWEAVFVAVRCVRGF